jgi:hypothetical protein
MRGKKCGEMDIEEHAKRRATKRVQSEIQSRVRGDKGERRVRRDGQNRKAPERKNAER